MLRAPRKRQTRTLARCCGREARRRLTSEGDMLPFDRSFLLRSGGECVCVIIMHVAGGHVLLCGQRAQVSRGWNPAHVSKQQNNRFGRLKTGKITQNPMHSAGLRRNGMCPRWQHILWRFFGFAVFGALRFVRSIACTRSRGEFGAGLENQVVTHVTRDGEMVHTECLM